MLPEVPEKSASLLNATIHLFKHMTKCEGPHHDFDDFDDCTTYDFTTFTTLLLLIDLETHFCTINAVSRSITKREVVKVVRS